MRLFILSLLCVAYVVAKPVEEKSKPLKSDDLQPSNVSPTTEPPVIQTEVIPHENHPDGEPTFEQEIARVIEGSVENLIPFGASEKPSVVKKESPIEEQPKNSENDSNLSVIDWFGMIFNNEMKSTTTEAPQEPTENAMESLKLGYLQLLLNQQRQMAQEQHPVEEVKQEKPSFAEQYQQWQQARQMATQWFNPEPQQQKQDQYSAAVKSKLNWDKLLAEPVEETSYKQYIPTDNTVQFSSNEIMPNEMFDNTAQKQLIIPSNYMKNKEQWFGESDI